MTIASALIDFYRERVPEGGIALHEPQILDSDKAHVMACLDSGWVSSVGGYISKAEQLFCQYTGADDAVAVVNGTAALHLALLGVGVEPDEEVLTPSLTFVATTNAIHYCGAAPHFVDVDEQTLSICPIKLAAYLASEFDQTDQGLFNPRTGKRLSALVVVHIFGIPAKLEEICAVASQFGLKVVEDCAESLGSWYRETHTGLVGDVGAFSFNGNKIVTSGGGGMIISRHPEYTKRLRHLSTTAKSSQEGFFFHDEVGFNYRMPNLNAALLYGQLERLPDYLDAKQALTDDLAKLVANFPEAELVKPQIGSVSNNWLVSIKVPPEQQSDVIERLNANGIFARPLWQLNHTLPMYQACPKADLATSELLVRSVISLPSSPFLSQAAP